mmetsp:Transcript_49210/g.123719  ORF Transcript_49210/g.123719 Transcript_49210/m.123719 type:complete len:82 (-) Transcript_49210:3590-3835(-)
MFIGLMDTQNIKKFFIPHLSDTLAAALLRLGPLKDELVCPTRAPHTAASAGKRAHPTRVHVFKVLAERPCLTIPHNDAPVI